MDIGERISFNAKVMHYCLKWSDWKPSENENEALSRYGNCMTNAVIAEQIFRAELNRVRPGFFVYVEED